MDQNKKILLTVLVVLIVILGGMLVVNKLAKKNAPSRGITSGTPASPSSPGNLVTNPTKATPVTEQVTPKSQIYFDPATKTVGGQQNFTLDAKVDPQGNMVTAVEMHVTFDPSKFQIVSIASPADIWSTLQAAKMDNVNGTASIIVGITPKSPPVPVTQPTTVATFTLKAVGTSGIGQVNFNSNTRAAAEGSNSNVVIKMTGSQVTIGQ